MKTEDFAASYGLVKALKGKLFKSNEYNELIEKEELGDYLQAIYSRLIQKNAPALDEFNFETILNFENIEVVRRIQVFLKDDLKEFLELLKLKYYIYRIQYAIHKIETNEIIIFNDYIDSLWCRYTAQPRAFTFHEFLSFIRNPELKEMVELSYLTFKSGLGKELLTFNVGLERRYFNSLFEFSKKFDSENQGIIKSLIGEMTEIEVIIWMLRMRLIYKMTYEEIIPLIPQFNIFLKYHEFNNLISVENIDEAYMILESSYYGKYFKSLQYSERNIGNISNEFRSKFENQVIRFFNIQPFSFRPILSYFVLKRFEVFRLISIAEGFKQKFNRETLKELIF